MPPENERPSRRSSVIDDPYSEQNRFKVDEFVPDYRHTQVQRFLTSVMALIYHGK